MSYSGENTVTEVKVTEKGKEQVEKDEGSIFEQVMDE